jgi:hypothetical protein
MNRPHTTNQESEFYFLYISQYRARLFKGFRNGLTEVIDENFPKTFSEEFGKLQIVMTGEFSLNGEGVKSVTGQRKIRALFQNIDYMLFLYLEKHTPLFIGGMEQDISCYSHITNYSGNVAGYIEGDLDSCTSLELEEIIGKELERYSYSAGYIGTSGYIQN